MHHEYNNALVLAAHADDEVIGALGWIRRSSGVMTVAFLTDGTPPARWRPPGYTEGEYRQRRREEARAVWKEVRAGARLLFAPFRDQQLSFCLSEAAVWLRAAVARLRPAVILAPAFEGGHPDHDAVNLLACTIAGEPGTPVWEYALYTAHRGHVLYQQFPGEEQWTTRLDPAAAEAKRAALAGYSSQAQTLQAFCCEREALRPLPQHDYRLPALSEPAVYELWGWPWSAEKVGCEFAAFLDRRAATCAS